MNQNDKITKLTDYLNKVKMRLQDTVIPLKHEHRVVSYREFLQREVIRTTKKLDQLKLSQGKI